jgi:hypothetical protein
MEAKMDVREFFLGRGQFKSADEVAETVRQSKNFDDSEEDPSNAGALLIFQTSKQQTWLVATRKRLYCILDDLGRAFTRVEWSMPRKKLVAQGNLLVRIKARDRTGRTGLVDIGDEHCNWLFSRKLFTNETVESRIRDLITRQMLE